MANMQNEKVEMKMQDGLVRRNNFSEVSLGYTKEEAILEATRCLGCKHRPCVSNCPVNLDIPEFIEKITEGKFEESFQIIRKSSSLSSVCGRVCPQETQCEMKCVRGIKGESVAIGRLERFVSDYHNDQNVKEEFDIVKNGKTVAIVGSGPAGLACAYDLQKLGYQVTIFEALHAAGGVLTYGIPEFRLPKTIVKKEIEVLKNIGVEICTNVVIGKTITVDELLSKFDAVYIASGAGLPNFMNIEGENLKGVFSANEILTRFNLMKAYDKVDTPIYHGKSCAIIGGGNVAMDAARAIKRLGIENVYVIYRRGMDELPARLEEVHHAEEEGIIFKTLVNPVRIIGDDQFHVKGIELIKMELGEPDASGRKTPVAVKDSNFVLDVDSVVMSIGTSPNPLIRHTTNNLDVDSRGRIITDDFDKTSIDKVYAGGDAVSGAATVIKAMGNGKSAAKNIHESLNK